MWSEEEKRLRELRAVDLRRSPAMSTLTELVRSYAVLEESTVAESYIPSQIATRTPHSRSIDRREC